MRSTAAVGIAPVAVVPANLSGIGPARHEDNLPRISRSASGELLS